MDGLQARLEAAIVKKPGATQADAGVSISVSSAQSLLRQAQLAIEHWKEVDLDEKRKGWEASTLEVANAQEASTTSRKVLAESTKAFRKLDDGEKLVGWGTLLKSYQGEIDSLTKRSKAAELAFLSSFKALRDIPNPVPLLSSLAEEVESVIALKTDHDKVRKELAEYKEEFQSLKNQDVTIRRLEEKIGNMEQEREESVAHALEEERRVMEERFLEKQEREKSREKELQQQVKDLKAQIGDLNRKHDEQQSASMESRAELEWTVSARQSQVDLLSEEVDRLAGQVAAVEKEKEQINAQYLELWRKNYAQPSEAADASTVSKVVELETALESREGRLKQLTLQVAGVWGTGCRGGLTHTHTRSLPRSRACACSRSLSCSRCLAPSLSLSLPPSLPRPLSLIEITKSLRQVEILEESLHKEREAARASVDQHVRALRNKEHEMETLKSSMAQLPSREEVGLKPETRNLQELCGAVTFARGGILPRAITTK